ncbi:MAG: transcription termination/antitermination protein NusG [Janthinobacterium lividum]
MAQVHKWYTIHTSPGSEKKVKQMIADQIEKQGMAEHFENILIPVIEVSGVRRGKAVKTEKNLMPGYIFIKMNINDESWRLVKRVPKISGFLGSNGNPQELKDEDIQRIIKQLETEASGATSIKLYDVGEQIVVVDGPFDSFVGLVEEVDNEKQRLRVSISIFGKATPIDLNFTQIKKG